MKQEELGLILKLILTPVSQILTISSLLLFDSVAITRYVMIFWLKNPGALNDDICSCLINVWIYFFAVISQIGFLASQGSIWILFLYNLRGKSGNWNFTQISKYQKSSLKLLRCQEFILQAFGHYLTALKHL